MKGILKRMVAIGRAADHLGEALWRRTTMSCASKEGPKREPLKAGMLLRNRYKVEGFLFGDGRRNHYIARDIGGKRTYELREYPDDQGIEAEREIVTKQLNHRGMVRRYDLFDGDSRTYLVSDYHGAPDLENTPRVLSPRDILSIAFNLADTLNYLHSHGIAHIELSARNVKDMGGIQKIIDFSACRQFSGPSTEGFREAKAMDFLGLVDLVEKLIFRMMEESDDPFLLYLIKGLEELVATPPISAEDFKGSLSGCYTMAANVRTRRATGWGNSNARGDLSGSCQVVPLRRYIGAC